MLETLTGRAVSWAEISVVANVGGGVSLPTIDIKSINHESKVDIGEQRGASGGRVMKRTTGALTNTASAVFYRDGLRTLKKALMTAALISGSVNSEAHIQLSLVTFDIVVMHSWLDDPEIHCRKFVGCRLFKDGGKHEEGTEAETSDVDLNPLRIIDVVNGVDTVLL